MEMCGLVARAPELVWTWWQREHSMPPVRNQTPLVQIVDSHYTDQTILAHSWYIHSALFTRTKGDMMGRGNTFVSHPLIHSLTHKINM